MKIVLLALAVGVAATDAFTVVSPTTLSRSSLSRLHMSEDLPSDSSSMDTLDVVSEAYLPDENEELVGNVLDDLPTTPSFAVNKETRSKINEALLKLETVNPTKDPTTSPLLNGVWSLRYVGGYSSEGALPSPTRQLALFLYSGGYSPGFFGLNIAQSLPSALVETEDFLITITRDQPRISWVFSFKLFGGAIQKIKALARLDVESSIRITENYESAVVLGQTVEIPSPARYSRELLVSYLDDDILVMRDATGVPEVYLRKEYGA